LLKPVVFSANMVDASSSEIIAPENNNSPTKNPLRVALINSLEEKTESTLRRTDSRKNSSQDFDNRIRSNSNAKVLICHEEM